MPIYEPKKPPDWMKAIMPPLPEPPSAQETGKAWGEVIEKEPTPGGTYLPFLPKVNLEKLGKAAYGTASTLTSAPGLEFLQPLQIKAFHGSPYKFSKFENKAIGTGEGAQAFGYGHYLTESPEVAEKYKSAGKGLWQYEAAGHKPPVGTAGHMALDTATDMNMLLGYKKQGPQAADMAEYVQGVIEERIARYRKSPYSPGSPAGQDMENLIKYYEDHVRNVNPKAIRRYEGNIYETTIHKGKQPGEYTYLEWDKPIPENFKYKINNILERELGYEGRQLGNELKKDFSNYFEIYKKGGTYRVSGGNQDYGVYNTIAQAEKRKEELINSYSFNGKTFYEVLSQKVGGAANASKILSEAGFSGIKYPTGSLSGIKGSKEYNYVVFNPEDITIEKVK